MEITLPGSILFCAASSTMQCTADCVWIIELYFLMVLSTTPSYPCLSQSMLIFILRRWSMPSGPSITCRGPSTPRRARNSAFIEPSADCAEASPFHSDGVRDLLLAQAE